MASPQPVRVRIICTHCGREYGVPAKHLGQTVRCRCGEEIDLIEPKTRVSCPSCDRAFQVRRRHLGKEVECRCGESFALTSAVLADRIRVHRIEPAGYLRIALAMSILWAAGGELTKLLLHSLRPAAPGGENATAYLSAWPLTLLLHAVMGLVAALICLWLFNITMRRTGGWAIRLGRAAKWEDGLRTLTRVAPASVALVCLLGGLMWGIIGAVLTAALGDMIPEPESPLVVLLLTPALTAVLAAIAAVAYNILADRFEGIRVQVSVPADTMVGGADPSEGEPIPVQVIDPWKIGLVGLAAGALGALVLLPLALLFGGLTSGESPQMWGLLALPVLGYVVWALDALIYNAAARIVGGVKLTVS